MITATCEWCGGIVSQSREKGDASKPMRAEAQSAGARYWHHQCAQDEQRYYIGRRQWRATEEENHIDLEGGRLPECCRAARAPREGW